MRTARPLGAVVLIAAACCAGAVTASPAAARGRLCDERAGTTLAASSKIRVFRDFGDGDGDPVIRGCGHRSRATVRLAADGDCLDVGSVSKVVVAGRFAAISRVRCSSDTASSTVILYDVLARRNLLGSPAYTGALPPAAASSVAELVLNLDGALAWIGAVDMGAGTGPSEVHLLRAGQRVPELLDLSRATDLTDLALSDHRLYWLHAGFPRVLSL